MVVDAIILYILNSTKLKQPLVDLVRQRINLNYFFIGDGNMSGGTSFHESVKNIRFSNLYANSFRDLCLSVVKKSKMKTRAK